MVVSLEHSLWPRAKFSWEIPAQMNTAFYVCDAHAEDKEAVAIYREDYTGTKGKITFWGLKNISNQLADYLVHKGLHRGDKENRIYF